MVHRILLLALLFFLAIFSKHSNADECDRNSDKAARVLITGASGMIGSHVAHYLLSKQQKDCYKVYALVRPRSDLAALNPILHLVTFLYGDLTDPFKMYEIIEESQPEYVFHFGAQAINGISNSLPHLTFEVNIQGTVNLLEAIRRANIKPRVVVAGSSTEYGQAVEGLEIPVPEDLHMKPITPYGISKLATENIANLYHISYGIPTITARLFIHIGIGGTDFLAIQQFCRQIAMGELGLGPTTIYHGDLSTARDMTDSKDSAPVLVKLVKKGIPGEAYNIGSGTSMTIQELLDIAVSLAKVEFKTELDKSRLRSFDEKFLVANNSKIVALTGWTPSTNMTGSINTILKYWRTKLYGIKPNLYDL